MLNFTISNKFNKINNYWLFLLGGLSGLAFAPSFLIFFLLNFSILIYSVKNSDNYFTAFSKGYVFGLGHFLISLYWVAIGVGVYIEDFWWFLPFAFLGLPSILACFFGVATFISWFFRRTQYYHWIFSIVWVFLEWLRSSIFPWNLIAYSCCFSDILLQIISVIGIYGLSFIVIYASSTLFHYLNRDNKNFFITLTTTLILCTSFLIYGSYRINNNPTNFLDIKVKLVQPSIKQEAKWDNIKFWDNVKVHIDLSYLGGKSDIIIWSEAALVMPYNYPPLYNIIQSMLKNTQAILITGGITEHPNAYYNSLYALDQNGKELFEYNKAHLVPFGEYVPFRKYIPMKKITHGFTDYSAGERKLMLINQHKLTIKPLICYESIFAEEVRVNNRAVDVIINVTNDSWYGRSFGPYQHFHISRVRAIENGLPMIRVANNGISAIIDPLGLVIKSLKLNEIGVINELIPKKITKKTIYSQFGCCTILIILLVTICTQFIVKFIFDYIVVMCIMRNK